LHVRIESRRQRALEALLWKRAAVAQQAKALLTVQHDLLAANGVARLSGQGLRERFSQRLALCVETMHPKRTKQDTSP
jgi:hypothetical protein